MCERGGGKGQRTVREGEGREYGLRASHEGRFSWAWLLAVDTTALNEA